MNIWLPIIFPSAFIGISFAIFLPRKAGLICSGAVPWFGLLAWLLYQQYFVPYKGGGASMWPIAQLVAGTVAAATGIIFFLLWKTLSDKIQQSRK